MIKKIFCFLLCFFSGIVSLHALDEMNYHLTIKDGKFQEQIVFRFQNYQPITNGDDPKRVIIQQPIYADRYQQTKYQKDVKKSGNNYVITLKHTYNEYQFKNSYLLSFCFDRFNYSYNKQYYYFSLSSLNNCFVADKLNVQLTSNLKMLSTNGKKINDQTYEWEIGKNANISFQLSKTLKYTDSIVVEKPNEQEQNPEKTSSYTGWILIILGISFLLLFIALFCKYRKNYQRNNSI